VDGLSQTQLNHKIQQNQNIFYPEMLCRNPRENSMQNTLYFGDNLHILHAPTEPMRKEAVSAGFYTNPYDEKFPKIQILTIADLLAGKMPQYRDFTMGGGSFKAARTEKQKGDQPALFGE